MNRAEEKTFAKELFAEIAENSADQKGVTRPSYSPEETAALVVIAERAHKLGMQVRADHVSNLWLTPKNFTRDTRYVLTGSHVDTVPQGGNYDGLAGVVAGIIAVARLGDDAPAKVIALRGEEGAWFDRPYKGSFMLFGEKLTEADVALEVALEGARRHLDEAGRGIIKHAAVDLSKIAAFIELHIEQGPVLVDAQRPVAAVTGICGNMRYRIRCTGETGHSGTTPVGLRKDPVFAAVELLHVAEGWHLTRSELGVKALIALADLREREESTDFRVTCGVIGTNPNVHAITKIADSISFSLECRCLSAKGLALFDREMRSDMRAIEDSRGVKIEVTDYHYTRPAKLDVGLIVRDHTMPTFESGAGHDAAVFSDVGIPSGMIFVRNQNGSHNPNEAIDLDDFMIGVDVLEASLRKAIKKL